MDRDGYGSRRGQTALERLLEDSRTLSPLGVERVAAGWEHHAGGGSHDGYREAEHAALHVLETTGRAAEWDALRNQLLGLTERPGAMIAWRLEHGATGHRAENALLGAALALLAGKDLDQPHHEELVRPMAEALPWLLSGRAR